MRRSGVGGPLALVAATLAGVTTVASGAAPASPLAAWTATINVPAHQDSPLVDTGLLVSSGSKVSISGSGLASYGSEGQPYCNGNPTTTPDGQRSVTDGAVESGERAATEIVSGTLP